MLWEGLETPTVRQHPYGTVQQSHIGKGIQLIGDTIHLIEEPPCGPKPYLALNAIPVEVVRHGGKEFLHTEMLVEFQMYSMVKGVSESVVNRIRTEGK